MHQVRAYAKVNLTLHLVGRRQDGYHLLQTVMAKIGLHDLITFAPAAKPGIIFDCPNRPELAGNDNLVVRAAQLIMPTQLGVTITLIKQIPAGAGLGGGSSDAAATLVQLNAMFKLGYTLEQLMQLGAKLGADIPYFISSSPFALAEGIGTEITPLPTPKPLHLVVIFPGFSVPTAWAYQQVRVQLDANQLTLSGSNDKRKRQSWHDLLGVPGQSATRVAQAMHNDLERVVAAHYSQIGMAKALLLQHGAIAAMMSGSGSAVFGLFADGKEAGQAVLKIRQGSDGWCEATQTIAE